jgi:hypothetical protein
VANLIGADVCRHSVRDSVKTPAPPPLFSTTYNDDTSQTRALILINLQRFGLAPSGLLRFRVAHLGQEEFGLAVRHQGYPHCRRRYPHHG